MSGTVPKIYDPTEDLFYPDWGRTENCIKNGDGKYLTTRKLFHFVFLGPVIVILLFTYSWSFNPITDINTSALYLSLSLSDAAPPYMKKQPALWMYDTLEGCCQAYYGWKGSFNDCMIALGGDPPTKSPIPESWCKYPP